MIRKTLSVILTTALIVSLTACAPSPVAVNPGSSDNSKIEESLGNAVQDTDDKSTEEDDSFRIGIVTGSYSQSEDDRRGAEAFQEKYGKDMVTLAIYPDNFTEEAEVTMDTIVSLSEDPKIKAIIVNQAIEGTTDAFKKVKEKRPDILCIAGETFDDFDDIKSV